MHVGVGNKATDALLSFARDDRSKQARTHAYAYDAYLLAFYYHAQLCYFRLFS